MSTNYFTFNLFELC